MTKMVPIVGDITLIAVDAIVNAANSRMRGGGGVDGAIHKVAGPELLQYEEDNALFCPTGQAVVTPAFELPAKHIIHTVGPIYPNEEERTLFSEEEYATAQADAAKLLAEAYESSIELANSYNLRTISFPAISTGIYGYPLEDATAIAVNKIGERIELGLENVDYVYFVCFDYKTHEVYKRHIANYQAWKLANQIPDINNS